MGNTINSSYDEMAFFFVTENKGYLSSNRPNGKGGFDIYTAVNNDVKQLLKGHVQDLESKIKLPNTLIVLSDEDNTEVARQLTDENGEFKFENIRPFETYTLTTQKDGFENGTFNFLGNEGNDITYNKDLELTTTAPIITEVDKELRIVIENIYFDFAKYSIKEESQISLNKIIEVLNEHPEMKLAINAHTDNKGRDSYNLNLSDKRAASALKYLLAKGITKNRLQSKGFGETKPLIDCKNNCSDEDLQSNRRVEFVILD